MAGVIDDEIWCRGGCRSGNAGKEGKVRAGVWAIRQRCSCRPGSFSQCLLVLSLFRDRIPAAQAVG